MFFTASVAFAQWQAPGTASATTPIQYDGNVGIGTGSTAPPQRFTVKGGHIALDNGQQLIGRNSGNAFYFRLIGNDASDRIILGDSTGTIANEIRFHTNASATPTMVIATSGNVGIGTTIAPLSLLNLQTNSNEVVRLDRAGAGWNYIATYRSGVRQGLVGDLSTGWGMWIDGTTPMTFMTNGGYERMRIDSLGNVGIGTTAPGALLHLMKSAAGALGPEVRLENAGNAIGDVSAVTFSDNNAARAQIRSTVEPSPWNGTLEFLTGIYTPIERMRVTGAGFVGIGTPAPSAKMHVEDLANNVELMVSAGDAPGVPNSPTMTLLRKDGNHAQLAKYGLKLDAADGNKLKILYGTTGGFTSTVLTVDPAGNLLVDGNITAKYQDIAEWVPAGGELPAGTVVVLNRMKSNEVTQSMKAYDTAVAGVVSGQPGVLLGQGGTNKAKIATSGRVNVRVDARKHAVEVGDLLVTSDNPGMAMFSEPLDLGGVKLHRPGTLIGKALEPLAAGEGEILVLLSLQ
jgi:hypothetical protein